MTDQNVHNAAASADADPAIFLERFPQERCRVCAVRLVLGARVLIGLAIGRGGGRRKPWEV